LSTESESNESQLSETGQLDGKASAKKHPALSNREHQVITLAGEGLTDYAIASRLGISEPTVKSYWVRVRSKMGPSNRTELVALALKEACDIHAKELTTTILALREKLSNAGSKAAELRRAILEKSQDAALEVDDNGKFMWINATAEKLFGYSIEEIKGQHVNKLVPQQFRSVHDEHMINFYKAPFSPKITDIICTNGIRKNGEEFKMVGTLGSLESTEGLVVTCLIRHLSVEHAVSLFVGKVVRAKSD